MRNSTAQEAVRKIKIYSTLCNGFHTSCDRHLFFNSSYSGKLIAIFLWSFVHRRSRRLFAHSDRSSSETTTMSIRQKRLNDENRALKEEIKLGRWILSELINQQTDVHEDVETFELKFWWVKLWTSQLSTSAKDFSILTMYSLALFMASCIWTGVWRLVDFQQLFFSSSPRYDR